MEFETNSGEEKQGDLVMVIGVEQARILNRGTGVMAGGGYGEYAGDEYAAGEEYVE